MWYGVRTRVNNREPLFRRHDALVLFARVFLEAEARFAFEVRGLCFEDDRLVFYLKPEDGFALPAIMKWLKQTFAVRFNRRDGRTGHIWGDRYESRVLEGEPDVGADSATAAGAGGARGVNLAGAGLRGGRKTRVRPFGRKPAGKALFSHLSPHPPPPPPA
ncbi:MAG: transposase [Spirochaetaceae bacterium]|nr:transposase [Spirochaetaceae bacterium]